MGITFIGRPTQGDVIQARVAKLGIQITKALQVDPMVLRRELWKDCLTMVMDGLLLLGQVTSVSHCFDFGSVPFTYIF